VKMGLLLCQQQTLNVSQMRVRYTDIGLLEGEAIAMWIMFLALDPSSVILGSIPSSGKDFVFSDTLVGFGFSG